MEKFLSNSKNRLLCVGSVAFDTIETPFGGLKKTLGGSASYFSLAASYFVKPAVVGVVGKDFTKKHFEILSGRGVDVSGIKQALGKTFHWSGKYHFDLNTRDTLKTELGVFEHFSPSLTAAQADSPYVFLANIHPALQLKVFSQIKHPKLVGLDTMNLWIEKHPKQLKTVLRKVDVFVINDSEARQFSGQNNLVKAAASILKLMRKTKNIALVIKRGEYGLLMFRQGQLFSLPGFLLESPKDPTGAGDSFAGGMMGYLAASRDFSAKNFKAACVYGTLVASFSVEEFGTRALQNLSRQKIQDRLKLYKNQLSHL